MFRKGNPRALVNRRRWRNSPARQLVRCSSGVRRICRVTPTCRAEGRARAYAAALQRNGFFGPNAWYMNHQRNNDYAARALDGGKLYDAGK